MLHSREVRHDVKTDYRWSDEAVFHDICSALFQSLPRSDQRRKGAEYLRGLLSASGRKSIRNIAALGGGPATEQGLHHFIHNSTWDWRPVRRALADHIDHNAPIGAWVVRPMVIPKSGSHSVGVGRRFLSDHGRTANVQQSIGVWAASDRLTSPVNWRLHLSDAWLADQRRRRRASIPESVQPESLGECAVRVCLEMTTWYELPTRPVVLDARHIDILPIIHMLLAPGMMLLARIDGSVPLTVVPGELSKHPIPAMTAAEIAAVARATRRPVTWRQSGRADRMTHVASTVRVRVPGAGELTLLAGGRFGEPWPQTWWLTNLAGTSPATLSRLGALLSRVDRDFTEIATGVGIRDFVGRSYGGWHRHVTLASAAHAVIALTGAMGAAMVTGQGASQLDEVGLDVRSSSVAQARSFEPV